MNDHLAYIIVGNDDSDDIAWVCKTAYTDEQVAIAKMEEFVAKHPANTYKLFEVIVTDDGLNVGNC